MTEPITPDTQTEEVKWLRAVANRWCDRAVEAEAEVAEREVQIDPARGRSWLPSRRLLPSCGQQ
jgi:hypothetical protein